MAAGRCGRQRGGDVQPGVGFRIHMVLHPRCIGAAVQALGKGGAVAAAHGVVQLERPAQAVQALGHGQQGRQANAAGQQQAVGRVLGQREVVARCADLQHIALVNRLVHGLRATARAGLLQHAQQVAVGFGGVVAQRIGALQALRQLHFNVRAGSEGRQVLAGRRLQFEAADVQCFAVLARHAHGQEGVGRG